MIENGYASPARYPLHFLYCWHEPFHRFVKFGRSVEPYVRIPSYTRSVRGWDLEHDEYSVGLWRVGYSREKTVWLERILRARLHRTYGLRRYRNELFRLDLWDYDDVTGWINSDYQYFSQEWDYRHPHLFG